MARFSPALEVHLPASSLDVKHSTTYSPGESTVKSNETVSATGVTFGLPFGYGATVSSPSALTSFLFWRSSHRIGTAIAYDCSTATAAVSCCPTRLSPLMLSDLKNSLP